MERPWTGDHTSFFHRSNLSGHGGADSLGRSRFWLLIVVPPLLIVLGVIFLVIADGKLTSLRKASSDQARAASREGFATNLVLATGEHELDEVETTSCLALVENVWKAGLNQVTERGSPGVSFWSEGQAFGATGRITGRFCEFYLSEDVHAQTIWFRNTSGVNQEFPREQVMFRIEKDSQRAVVAAGAYFKEGEPVWMSKELALERIKASEEKWLDALQASPEMSPAN